ncbi:hypothetical protein [Variovorax sp. dw_954]|uniref:hypothetical protein n=1 Tax=Variovorax sp. dw_954 TaxID=2720078 RepID=UPI001BD64419|nr:hypothetical protein [Variovorax sp. dw_954]
MQLPRSQVSKIFITGNESPSVGFVPAGGDERASYSWLTLDHARLRDRHAKLGLLEKHPITSPEGYLDALGTSPASDDAPLQLARKAERIDRAKSFTKTTKGGLAVYFVDAAEPGDRRLYFAIRGDNSLYVLAGALPRAFVNALLSSLRVKDP